MKIQIEKKDLIHLLSRAQSIVEKRTTMPILTNVLMEASKNDLTVFATDLGVSLTDSMPAVVEQEGQLAVSAKNLFEIIKELAEKPITLLKKENNWLEIKQGKYLSKIVGLKSEDYPIFPTNSGTGFFKVESQVLKEMIDKTIFSVSTDETRHYLNGVYFEQTETHGYNMVATDGHRLCLVNRPMTPMKMFSEFSGIIIPKKGLQEIRKILETIDGSVEIAVEGAQLIIRKDKTLLMVRLTEGKYPNYTQFIPQKLNKIITLNREEFLTSIRRVSLLANQKSKVVTLSFTAGKLEITSVNPDQGDAKEEIEVIYEGQDLKVGFNAKYIQEVLSSMTEKDVEIQINDHLSPGLMRPHNDPNYLCVVMPMRL